jgi:hypothetical protein
MLQNSQQPKQQHNSSALAQHDVAFASFLGLIIVLGMEKGCVISTIPSSRKWESTGGVKYRRKRMRIL